MQENKFDVSGVLCIQVLRLVVTMVDQVTQFKFDYKIEHALQTVS